MKTFNNIRVLVNDSCNLRCSYCHNEFQGSEHGASVKDVRIDVAALEHIIETRLPSKRLSFKISGGEPTLSFEATDTLIQFAHNAGFGNVVLLSNLVSVSENNLKAFVFSGLSEVRVMMPSFEGEVYSKITGASPEKLGKVLQKCKWLREQGLKVRANMVVDESRVQNGTEKFISQLIKKYFCNRDMIDEIGLLVDARSNDQDDLFCLLSKALKKNASSITSHSYRKLDSSLQETEFRLRKCEDWEGLEEKNIHADELRIVAPAVMPVKFRKGRAYEH